MSHQRFKRFDINYASESIFPAFGAAGRKDVKTVMGRRSAYRCEKIQQQPYSEPDNVTLKYVTETSFATSDLYKSFPKRQILDSSKLKEICRRQF